MQTWHNEQTDALCEALLSLKTKEEGYAFLEDICTIREVLDIAQRLSVAQMLDQGVSYSVISQQTGASKRTGRRARKCYVYGSTGYKPVRQRLKGDNGDA